MTTYASRRGLGGHGFTVLPLVSWYPPTVRGRRLPSAPWHLSKRRVSDHGVAAIYLEGLNRSV